MAKDPATLWYFNDWSGGTITMTRHLKGCYMDILCAQFNKGHLSLDEVKIVLGNDFAAWQGSLQEKFVRDENGKFFNQKLETEMNKRKIFTQSRRDNLAGKNKEEIKELDTSKKHMGNHMENRDINEFIIFWDLYNKKVGDKNRCEKKFNKLTIEIQKKIIETLPKFKLQFSDKQFQPFPESYLNQQRWNDEIIIKDGNEMATEQKIVYKPVPAIDYEAQTKRLLEKAKK